MMAYAGLLRLAFESLCNNCQRSEVLDDLPAEGGEKKDCLVIFFLIWDVVRFGSQL
jgi:hypothetical protein